MAGCNTRSILLQAKVCTKSQLEGKLCGDYYIQFAWLQVSLMNRWILFHPCQVCCLWQRVHSGNSSVFVGIFRRCWWTRFWLWLVTICKRLFMTTLKRLPPGSDTSRSSRPPQVSSVSLERFVVVFWHREHLKEILFVPTCWMTCLWLSSAFLLFNRIFWRRCLALQSPALSICWVSSGDQIICLTCSLWDLTMRLAAGCWYAAGAGCLRVNHILCWDL